VARMTLASAWEGWLPPWALSAMWMLCSRHQSWWFTLIAGLPERGPGLPGRLLAVTVAFLAISGRRVCAEVHDDRLAIVKAKPWHIHPLAPDFWPLVLTGR
jgi:hypothetical protein